MPGKLKTKLFAWLLRTDIKYDFLFEIYLYWRLDQLIFIDQQ